MKILTRIITGVVFLSSIQLVLAQLSDMARKGRMNIIK